MAAERASLTASRKLVGSATLCRRRNGAVGWTMESRRRGVGPAGALWVQVAGDSRQEPGTASRYAPCRCDCGVRRELSGSALCRISRRMRRREVRRGKRSARRRCAVDTTAALDFETAARQGGWGDVRAWASAYSSRRGVACSEATACRQRRETGEGCECAWGSDRRRPGERAWVSNRTQEEGGCPG